MAKKPITIGIDASRAFVKDPAGPEYYSWHLIKNLAEIDKNNRYLLYLRPNQRPNFSLPKNFSTKTVYPNRFWTQLGLALETIINPPDILFIPAHTLPLLTRAIYGLGTSLKILPQMSILVTIHGLEGKFLPQSGSVWAHIHRNWSIAWSAKFANHLIAVSGDTSKDVFTTYKIDQNTITVVHEGVDYEKFANAKVDNSVLKQKYHINENYILFIGTLQPRKNLVRLIEAFSIYLKTKHKEDSRSISSYSKKLGSNYKTFSSFKDSSKLKLVIAGKPGWLYDEIMNAPKKFGIEERVLFTGRIEESDLPGLYKGAQAFILPSLTEGFGLPILEAQAAGVPVVSSDRGALKEVAGNGAIFIDPYKTKEIASAIGKILEDKVLRADMVKKGIENARKKSWKQTAYNTLRLIGKIAE